MAGRSLSKARMAMAMAVVATFAGLLVVMNERRREAAVELLAPRHMAAPAAASIGAPFSLLDLAGRRVTSHDFGGRHVLLMFAPLAPSERATAALQVASAALLGLGPRAAEVAPVLVAIAPEGEDDAAAQRRTAALLAPLDVAWTGLAAPREDVLKLARSYYVPVGGQHAPSARGAPPENAPIAFILNAKGAYLGHLAVPTDPAAMTAWIGINL